MPQGSPGGRRGSIHSGNLSGDFHLLADGSGLKRDGYTGCLGGARLHAAGSGCGEARLVHHQVVVSGRKQCGHEGTIRAGVLAPHQQVRGAVQDLYFSVGDGTTADVRDRCTDRASSTALAVRRWNTKQRSNKKEQGKKSYASPHATPP